MGLQITENKTNIVPYQSGSGAPNHLSPLGSVYVDSTTGTAYINKDGLNNWAYFYDSTSSITGGTNTYVTGFTFSSNTLTINQNNSQPPLSQTLTGFTNLSISGLSVSGDTIFTDNVKMISGLTVTTLSAATYLGNIITSITGLTGISALTSGNTVSLINTLPNIALSAGTNININNNIISVTGLSATTLSAGTNIAINGNYPNFDISVTGLTATTDTYTTGFTYSANTISLNQNNNKQPLSVTINSMTGLTINGILSANTIYGNGANINGLTSNQINTALGYTAVTNSRNITINGITYDLSADRTWGVTTSLSALTDVTLTGLTNNQLLQYDSSTFKWVNKTPTYISGNQEIILSGAITGSGTTAITTYLNTNIIGIANFTATGTPSSMTYLRGDNTWAVIPSAGSNGQIQFNSSGSFGGDSNFIWDNTYKKLILGNTSSSSAPTFQIYQPTTGIGTITTSGNIITGTNTQFTNTFKVGDIILLGGAATTWNNSTAYTVGQSVSNGGYTYVVTTAGTGGTGPTGTTTTPTQFGGAGAYFAYNVSTISAIASDTSMTTGALPTISTAIPYTLTGGNMFSVRGNGNTTFSGGLTWSPSTGTLQVTGGSLILNSTNSIYGSINMTAAQGVTITQGGLSVQAQSFRVAGPNGANGGLIWNGTQLSLSNSNSTYNIILNAGTQNGAVSSNPFYILGQGPGGSTLKGGNIYLAGGNGGNYPGDIILGIDTNGKVSGNVSIGTATTSSLFQVYQTTSCAGTITISGNIITGTNTQFTNIFKVGDTITVTPTTTAWSASTAYIIGNVVTNGGNMYNVTTAGTGGTGPTGTTTTPTQFGGAGAYFTYVAPSYTITAITSDTSMTVSTSATLSSASSYTNVGGARFQVFGNGNVTWGGSTSGGTNSKMWWDATNNVLNIGTSTSQNTYLLNVNGAVSVGTLNSLTLSQLGSSTNLYLGNLNGGNGGAAGTYNMSIGYYGMRNTNSSSNNNIGIGYFNFQGLTSGTYNVAIMPQNAGYQITTGSNNTLINAGPWSNVSNTTLIGAAAYTSSNNTVSVGYQASSGPNGVSIGYQAGGSTGNSGPTGTNNILIGYGAGQSITTASYSILIGTSTNGTQTSSFGTYNTFVGHSIFLYYGGSYNTFIGSQINVPTAVSNNIVISDGQGNQRIYVFSNGNVSIGAGNNPTDDGVNKLQISGTAYFSKRIVGSVNALTVTSNAVTLDCSLGNYFTITLPSSATTTFTITNIPSTGIGETITIVVTTGTSSLVSFPSTVKQPSGSSYIPTTTSAIDILSFVSLGNGNLYLLNTKNLV